MMYLSEGEIIKSKNAYPQTVFLVLFSTTRCYFSFFFNVISLGRENVDFMNDMCGSKLIDV